MSIGSNSHVRCSLMLLGACMMAAPSLFAATPLSFFPPVPATVSTVPGNGEGNPYGVAFVPASVGRRHLLQPGDLLVSNFNNGAGKQGEGTTIVQIRAGVQSVFYTAPAAAGWTGGLVILGNGIVVAGSLPTTDGTPATVQPGSLNFISPDGVLLQQLADANIDGPWGLAIAQKHPDSASIFISNVLSGTVVRLDLALTDTSFKILHETVIASGYTHALDPVAIVLGPSGLAYSWENDTLYVASSTDNAIYGILQARQTSGSAAQFNVVTDLTNLHGPVVMLLAPNGDLLVSNSDGSNSSVAQPSEIDEYTTAGAFVSHFSVDPATGGGFGIGFIQSGNGTAFAAVDDNTNTVTIWNTIVFSGRSEDNRGYGFGGNN